VLLREGERKENNFEIEVLVKKSHIFSSFFSKKSDRELSSFRSVQNACSSLREAPRGPGMQVLDSKCGGDPREQVKRIVVIVVVVAVVVVVDAVAVDLQIKIDVAFPLLLFSPPLSRLGARLGDLRIARAPPPRRAAGSGAESSGRRSRGEQGNGSF
jgi:hypothetical protein